MRAEDFLETARRLQPNGVESDARTAVGRAYYAVMIVVRDRIRETAGIRPSEKEAHAFVAEWLKRCRIERHMQRVSDNFNRLRTARGKADYEMQAPPENWSGPSVLLRIKEAEGALGDFGKGFALLSSTVVKRHAEAALSEVRRPR